MYILPYTVVITCYSVISVMYIVDINTMYSIQRAGKDSYYTRKI